MAVAREVFTVKRLTQQIRRLIEDGLPQLWVEGEISNHSLNRSGHRYFTLKDTSAQISCVMWRTRVRPSFDVTDGLKVKLFGAVTVWEQGGRYQMDVQQIQKAGIGPLQIAYEELKKKLDSEGLFDVDRKFPLPDFPNSIGIVTSHSGAALKDILWSVSNRYPPVRLFLIPVKVQGDGSAEEISAAINTYNELHPVDVIVIGRGGGSLEDLWAFNEESVVRSISNSKIPVVSAVGHEVDITLSDLAADQRAPTPTAVGALVVPDIENIITILDKHARNQRRYLSNQLTNWRNKLLSVSRSYSMNVLSDRIFTERMKLDNLGRLVDHGINLHIKSLVENTKALGVRLKDLSPIETLKRGYCIVRDDEDKVINSGRKLRNGSNVNVQFSQDRVLAEVKEIILDE